MNLTFIETALFSRFRAEHISDDVYRALQNELLENPEKGDIVKGLNGVRKIRIPGTHNATRASVAELEQCIFTIRPKTEFIFCLPMVRMKRKT